MLFLDFTTGARSCATRNAPDTLRRRVGRRVQRGARRAHVDNVHEHAPRGTLCERRQQAVSRLLSFARAHLARCSPRSRPSRPLALRCSPCAAGRAGCFAAHVGGMEGITRSGDRVPPRTGGNVVAKPPPGPEERPRPIIASNGHAKTMQWAACGVRIDHMRRI